MIVKCGKKYCLMLADGRVYEHDTLHAAKAQESAINLSKARAAGYRIPRKRARHLKGGQWERLYGKKGARA